MKLIFAVAAMVLVSSCVDDDLDLDDTSQELSNVVVSLHGPGAHTLASYDKACFLAGVYGDLGSAGMEIRLDGKFWTLYVNGEATKVLVRTVCMTPPSRVSTYEWNKGDAPVNMGSISDRRCFLTGYGGLGGMDDAGDWVRVWRGFDNNLYLGGGGDNTSFGVTAACIQVTDIVSTTALAAAEWEQLYVPVATAADHAVCALTSLGGDWSRAELPKFGLGGVDVGGSPTNGWTMYASDRRKGAATCFRY